jgi:regulator of PEP synthase PpsR (kinase-PPPase family)
MLKVYLVSGSTTKRAEQMADAAIAQFEGASVKVIPRKKVRTPNQVRAIVEEARDGDAIILHTLVAEDTRRAMASATHAHGVDAVDLLGPVLDRLASHLKLTPVGKPGLLAQAEATRSREIEAVEFAFRHDDGRNMDDLNRAEVVLVGVSRSMKTPTNLYLAYRGWFAANVPLVPKISLPDQLLAVPFNRVFYLHMSADRLLELRRVRAERDGIPAEGYASIDSVREELRFAERTCLERRWRKINVTGKSVEEVSREIILLAPTPSPAQEVTEDANSKPVT